jgi:zinc protease
MKRFVIFVFVLTASVVHGQTLTDTLDNGFRFHLVENHSNPLIASVVITGTGSVNETARTSGMSHFLEHMLFNGTFARSMDELRDEIDRKGGYINAFTSQMVTAYIVVMPKHEIETGLDVQADMLFNSAFAPDMLEKERGIVIEEIRQGKDHAGEPADNAFFAELFAGTSLSRPVTGGIGNVEAYTRETVDEYYRTWYVPDNMLALVVGDFDSREMADAMRRYFGGFERGQLSAEPTPVPAWPTSGLHIRRIEVDDDLGRLYLALPGPSPSSPEYPTFLLAIDRLAGSDASPLQVSLTSGDDPPASRLFSWTFLAPEYSVWILQAQLTDPRSADRALGEVLRVLKIEGGKKPTQEELQRLSVSYRTQEHFLRERVHHYAMMRAVDLWVMGPEGMDELAENVARVKPGDVADVTRAWKNPIGVAVVTVPEGTLSPPLSSTKGTDVATEVLPNGLTVVARSDESSQVFAVCVCAFNRFSMEPPGKNGIASLLHHTLTAGTETRDIDRIETDLQRIGAKFVTGDNPFIPYDDVYLRPEFTYLRFETLDEFAPEALELLSDIVARPTFPEGEVERLKGKAMVGAGMENRQPYQRARALFHGLLYGDGSPLTFTGGPSGVMRVTADDLRTFHGEYFTGGNMIVAMAGSRPTDELLSLAREAFSDLPSGGRREAAVPSSTPGLYCDLFESTQTAIRIGRVMPGVSHPDASALTVATAVLSERLQHAVREERGLAYSVGAGTRFAWNYSVFSAQTATGNDSTVVALDVMRTTISNFHSDPSITEDEFEMAIASVIGGHLMHMMARINQAFYSGVAEYMGLGADYWSDYDARIRSVSHADVQRVAASEYFDPATFVTVVAGGGCDLVE